MHFRPRTWAAISLLCFLVAAVFWRLARQAEDRTRSQAPAANSPATVTKPATVPTAPPVSVPQTNAANTVATNPFPHRLQNTAKTLDQLMVSDSALLLRNALVDSSAGTALSIPAHLRAAGEPGAYVVQSRGVITEGFRAELDRAGAQVVSYVPNNAFLVRATAAAARQLEGRPGVQAVLAWEPYFKLSPALLAYATEQKPMPAGTELNLLLFPGEGDAVRGALGGLGITVTEEQPTPFGPGLRVRAGADSLVALAALPGVQMIERGFQRGAANDLTRGRLRVSTNTVTANNYLALSGAGVLVAVNDFGVDAAHPDLAGRVTGLTVDLDTGGHGTHVAGIIASSGANGPPGTNVSGSVSNANFRGMAQNASLFSQYVATTPDTVLQESAALTNSLIVNNSWGYIGDQDYSLASAVWDAAARDALPGVTGPQPLTLVFAAGNVDPVIASVFGSFAASVIAPGTSKNVITVGANENRRNITNEVTIDGFAAPVWLASTDSSNQVAGFSARGNVGVGQEGVSGRFKPDVVAPGTFIVSCRSTDFVDPVESRYQSVSVFPDQIVRAMTTNTYPINIPPDAVLLVVEPLPNRFTRQFTNNLYINYWNNQAGPPGNVIGVAPFGFTLVTPGASTYTVGNPNNFDVRYDLRTTLEFTNNTGDYFTVLKGLNDQLAPHYRYESGTSQSAAAVSGLLALMQEYYGTRLGRTNSPALMKALLINGARTLGGVPDFQVAGAANQQGWGLVNITNSAPTITAVDGGAGGGSGGLLFVDQDPARALITGESVTRVVNVTGNATNFPLRITLAWTDPPANPAVGPKLVNDLDLLVTNLVSGQFYVGNNFGGVFTLASAPGDSNAPVDVVNNVENVYISQRLNASYSVTVRARRVNVNAVSTQERGVAQDYALVISSGSPAAAPITVAPPTAAPINSAPLVTTVTNGVPLLHQRVGANSPLLVSTNGVTNQWHFFVVTNRLPVVNVSTNATNMAPSGTASNIAFTVFLAPNLSWPRTNNADLDLYVSTNPEITNLNQAAIEGSFRSVGRGGTEAVILANVTEGDIYYAGVKSEDQMAGEFGFFAVSSASPFSSQDPTNGNIVAQGYVLPTEIPDGAPDDPQAALLFAFVTQEVVVQNVTVTNTVTHGNLGDLLGVLEHNQTFSVLNNGQGNPPNYPGFIEWIFDDSGSGDIMGSVPTDPPGSLRNFVGEEGSGVWQLTMVDSSQFFTGRVDNFVITIEPRSDDLTNGVGIVRTIQPGRFFYTVVDVPNDATNLSVCVAPDLGPVEVYVKRGAFPTQADYDTFGFVAPPGGCVNLGRRDAPPLSAGRYFIGVFNPNSTPVTVRIRVFIERNLGVGSSLAYRSPEGTVIFDDAMTNNIIRVPRNQLIAEVSVGVRIDHPRVSDLALVLRSPSGTRVLLAENRGGLNGENYGFGTLQTNVVPASSTGGPMASSNTIATTTFEGSVEIDYDFQTIPDRMTVYYDGVLIYDTGLISGFGSFAVDYGPGGSTNVLIVMNEGGNANQGTIWDYTATILSGINYATFTDNTNFARLPIKFERPPFTNFTYAVTNFVTNAVVMRDGFEIGPAALFFTPGDVFSGWTLTAGQVDVTTDTPVSPWFTAPHSGVNFLDSNGWIPGTIHTNFPTAPGLDYLVGFWYTRNAANSNATTADVNVYDAVGPIATYPVTAPVGPPGVWEQGVFTFRANANQTTLEIESTTSSADPIENASGVFFDSVTIEQVDLRIARGIFYQPEEPLTRLRGENALGDWELEIWDSRIGAFSTNALIAWKLNITFVNTNPPVVTLTNGIEWCGTLGPNETAYFLVNVPLSASVASNLVVAADRVDFLYDQAGVPIGRQPPDTFFFTNRAEGLTVLATNGWNTFDNGGFLINASTVPQIVPGRRYYLAVENRALGPNPFCITVSFDRTDPNLLAVRPITNDCVTSATGTDLLDYYQYDVGSNTVQLTFTLDSLSDDLGLVVKPGFPLPDYNFFYRRSDNPGVALERIDVVDFKGMLLPGRWYIGVYNATQSTGITYRLCVDEITAEVNDAGTGGIFTNSVGPLGVDYFKVMIDSASCLASFCAFPTNGDVDVYIAPDRLTPVNATPTNTTLFSATPGIAPDCVTVSKFAATNNLTPGCWIMAVVNRGSTTVDYTADISQTADCLAGYTVLTNCEPYTNTITMADGTDYYAFIVSNHMIQVTFEVFGMSTNVDLFIVRGPPVPPPGPGNFQFASTNRGVENEFICLVTNYPSATLVPGTYLLAVVNRTPDVNATYAVRACAILTNDLTRLTNGLAMCRTIDPGDTNQPNSGVHFFTFNVTNSAVQWIVDTFNQDGDVDLYVQRAPPLTNFTTYTGAGQVYPYASTNLGTNGEYLCISGGSAPIALEPGPWFVTVVNRETNAVNYCLRGTQLTTNQIRRLTNNLALCGQVVGPFDSTTTNGVRYYSFRVATNAIATFFEAYNITNGDVDLFVQREFCVANYAVFDPASTNYPYASANPGTNSEWVCVATNSSPVPLAAGDWYVAVVNRSTNQLPVDYCVRAFQLFDTNVIRLANGVTRCPTGPGPIDYYVFNASPAAVQVVFEAFFSTNVDLFVSDGPCFPNLATFDGALTNFPYASQLTNGTAEYVCVATNSSPVPLAGGDWFAAVRRVGPGTACIRATQLLSNSIVTLASGERECGTVTVPTFLGYSGLDFYRFPIATNAVQATFEVTSTNGNVDIFLQYGLCLTNYGVLRSGVTNYPYVSTNQFANPNVSYYPYASTNLGTNTELICVVTNSIPVPLQGGDWYLTVAYRGRTNNLPIDYCVRAIQILDTEIAALTNRLFHFQSGLEPTNGMVGVGVDYYHYRAASNAIQFTVQLYDANGNVDLYAQKGPCWTDPLQFTYASTNPSNAAEHIFIATNSAPVPLSEGDWYFAVVNHHTPLGPVSYKLRLIEYLDTDMRPLTNCVTYTNLFRPPDVDLGQAVDYYVFEATTNTIQLFVEVTSLISSNNTDVHARRELILPRSDFHAYAGTNPPPLPELITISSNTVPATNALAPGLWFFAVTNATQILSQEQQTNGWYSIRLTEVRRTDVTPLTNNVPRITTLETQHNPPCQGVDYYVFRASPGAVQVTFKLFNVDGDLDAYIGTGSPLPSLTNHLALLRFQVVGAGVLSNSFTISTNEFPALVSEDWFIAVFNYDRDPVNYAVCATEHVIGSTNLGGIVRLENGMPYPNTVPPGGGLVPLSDRQFYVYTVSSNAVQANFEILNPSGNVDLYLRRGVPLPTEFSFDVAGENGGSTNELIILTTNSAPVALVAGDWYLTVVNRETVPVSYAARVTEFIIGDGSVTNGLVTRLENGLCLERTNAGTNALGSPAVDYYAFLITNGSVRAHFELFGLTGDLTLLARRGLPLPAITNYGAISANPGLCDELISLSSNSAAGLPLEPGLWFLAVFSTNAGPVDYTICARQYGEYGTNLRISSITLVTNYLCLTWTNTLAGVGYHVQALTHFGSSNWVALSPTLRAPGTSDGWCTNIPPQFHFFRIKEGPGPKEVNTRIVFTCLECNMGFHACWNGPTNQHYAVEWAPSFTSFNWQTLTNLAPAPSGMYEFRDPAAQCGPGGQPRYYRILPVER